MCVRRSLGAALCVCVCVCVRVTVIGYGTPGAAGVHAVHIRNDVMALVTRDGTIGIWHAPTSSGWVYTGQCFEPLSATAAGTAYLSNSGTVFVYVER